MKKRILSAVVAAAALFGLLALHLLRTERAVNARGPAKDWPHGLTKRSPWTTSRVVGSPDPPHPYRVERAFPKLAFRNPLLMARPPVGDRLFVGEHQGKIFSFPNDPKCAKPDLFIDLAKDLPSWDGKRDRQRFDALYGLAFHPRFEKNRYCYICYVLQGADGRQLPEGTRVSRFRVSATDPPRCDPKSEKILLTWLGGGHNGGDLHFGPDGFLYVSTGDGSSPNPPDARDTGQDISDLLSSILRIDVDRQDKGKPYAVPADNPFVKTPKARPEVWAYGFRNPWRMSFDRVTGDLWVGDVGWERWEMIYRIQRGGNYGWSVMEGRQPVRPESRRGPTPILPPALDFPHTEAASITGGYVYRGTKLKELVGTYICGDWVTRKLWGTRFDGDKVVSHRELAQGAQRVVAFGEDRAGELYFLNYDEVGTLHRLVSNPAAQEKQPDFPRKLSETGLFASVKNQTPASGVVPFSVNAAQWLDHATAERFVGVPGKESVRVYDAPIPADGFYSGQVFFPKNGVLAKTISLEMERGNPKSRRRLETQLLHFDGETWRGYSYRWNDAQTDAVLVPAAGQDHALTVVDAKAPGGKRRQTWHFPSRTECLTCHNPWAGYALAFTPAQLNRAHDYGGVKDNQLRALRHVGLIDLRHRDAETGAVSPLAEPPAVRLSDPYNSAADLDRRARSYLQVNCAHCHQFGAGGTADIELRHDVALDRTKTLEVRPVQGAFGLADAQILAPGDPYRSVLYYRMAKLGPGRMPHIGSEVVDERGLKLMHDWIRRLPIRKDERLLLERLRALDEPAVLARERATFGRRLERLAQDMARDQGRKVATAEDRKRAEARLKAEAAAGAKARASERSGVIGRLLATPSGALILTDALGAGRVPTSVRKQVLTAALAVSDAQVRDLFERFVPDEQRVKRLGSAIRPEQILSRKGDVARGRELFFKAAGLQCASCHRVGGVGSTLGPDLSQIGKKYTRAQILESILDPSKTVEPKYTAYVVETTDGKLHSGLLAKRNAQEVVLRQVGDKEVRLPAADVAAVRAQRASLMPEQLLRELTAEQAADLVDYLASLR